MLDVETMGIKDTLQQFHNRIKGVNEEIENEVEEDEPELQELDEVGKYGMQFEEAVEKMEQKVRKKHQKLWKAQEDLSRLDKHIQGIDTSDYSPGHYYEDIESLRDLLNEAMQNLEAAKDAQGNIEGLREQAEETLRKQLRDLEEFGSAEEQARSITADAEAKLMEMKEAEQEFEQEINRLEEEYS